MCQLVHGEGVMKDKYNLKNYLAHQCPESSADLKSIRLIEMQKKPDLMEVWPISSLHCPLLRMTSFLDCWKNLTHAPWLQYRAKEASLPFRGAEMPLKSFVMRNDFYRWNKKCESTIRAFYVLQPHWKILLILPSSILVCLHNHYFGGVGFKDFCHLI